MTQRRIADHLNALSDDAARAALAKCCGAARWVESMLTARPFANDDALFAEADRDWWDLAPDDWLEAFAEHPRIGERQTGDERHAATHNWSRREQSRVDTASAATRQALAQGNRAYEERFGHVFLICATGRSAEEMLSELERRLNNDPAHEREIAAREQAKITRLRLEKLVTQ